MGARPPGRLVQAALEAFGEIDVIVNNAGSAPTARFERTTDEMLAEVLDLHVAAPFRLLRSAIPHLRERGRGVLIQIASTASMRPFPLTSAYTAAKHAMLGITRSAAVELADTGVRSHAVCPGFVDTPMTRQAAAAVAQKTGKSEEQILAAYAGMNACGRLLTPEEVADAVLTFADPDCSLPSGTIAVLDDMPTKFVAPD